CKISYCSHCLIDHESAISCKQAEADRIKDPLNEEWKKNNNVKHCPQCGVWVEKISGCDYLECKKCRYSFCWQCLGPHDHNMGAHKHIS
ncbi:MAG: IBR domain-containing protein, partial [Candidatus Babeliales bacterium]